MAVRHTSKYETLRICKSLNATPQTKLRVPTPDELGFCTKIFATHIGENPVIKIETAANEGHICTIVLRGTTHNFLDDIERTLNNGIDFYRNMCRDNRFVPGAGCFEIRAAKHLQDCAVQLKGLEQYAVKEYGKAFEFLPRTLSENNGYNYVESVASM